jgi:two-component system, chemotaxis family, protein-glutamate methylesterase/glutaminase
VIVFSSHSKEGGYATLKALALGALDFVPKPQSAAAGHLDAVAVQLIDKIKVAKRVVGRKLPPAVVPADPVKQKKREQAQLPPNRVIAIGISTGGPNALQYVLSQIPADFPASFVIVQHMPEGFTEMFARRLDECCALTVQEAHSGDLLIAGRVLICPGNRHIAVRRMPRGDMAVLSDGPPVNGHRPSADVLFNAVAQEFGPASIGVIMTGMGEDGAEGLGAIKTAGGLTIAQSEDTCVVSGMPRAAILKGHAQKIVPLDGLGAFLVSHCGVDRVADKAQSDKGERQEKSSKSDKNDKIEKTPVSSHRS